MHRSPSPANVWLDVPLDDYEGHMRAAGVGQLDVLRDLFAEALTVCRPASVAILGVAGGNGLDAIDPLSTTRVVGVDINPEYLAATGRRFSFISGLDLRCLDLAAAISRSFCSCPAMPNVTSVPASSLPCRNSRATSRSSTARCSSACLPHAVAAWSEKRRVRCRPGKHSGWGSSLAPGSHRLTRKDRDVDRPPRRMIYNAVVYIIGGTDAGCQVGQ